MMVEREHVREMRLLERAASVELVTFLEREEFTTDLEVLFHLDPEVSFRVGSRPTALGYVFVSQASPLVVHLATVGSGGIGVYLKLMADEPGRPRRFLAVDPACGEAEQQRYLAYVAP